MRYLFFLPLLALHACGSPQGTAGQTILPGENSLSGNPSIVEPNKRLNSMRKTGIFDIEYQGIHLSAHVDEKGNVTILDWPTEWHIKGKIVRYADRTKKTPFNKEECETIRIVAGNGFAKDLVLSGYHSELIFEMPFFLSVDFPFIVTEALKAAGYQFSSANIKNPIDDSFGSFSLTFNPEAISNIIGLTWLYRINYNLINRGHVKNPLERLIIMTEGDLICDLISGDAQITVIHNIEGEEKTLKLIYDPVEVALAPEYLVP